MALQVDWRSSCSLVGSILQYLALPLLAPLGLAVLDGTDPVPFLVTIGVTLVVGTALSRLAAEPELQAREAFLMVALTWLAVALVAAIPFVVAGSGVFESPVNALFESMSGITTTGATTLVDFSAHSRAVMLWRQLIQWLGGLGILVLATALLSELAVGGAQLMETESQLQSVTKLTPKIADTAKLLWTLYIGLTAVAIATLYALGVTGVAPEMTLFDAIAHALTSVSTSGFSPRAESIAAFSPAVQWALVPFMVLGATSFILIYAALRGNFKRVRRSEELRFYLFVLGVLSVVMFALVWVSVDSIRGLEATARHAVFQIVSIVTTTGYASADFELWSAPAKQILLVSMFLGGMAGSTTCSIKMVRWLVITKAFRRDLFVAIRPESVRLVRLSGNVVDEETVRDIYAYTLVSLIFFVLASVVIVLDSARVAHPVTELEALGASASTFFNIGPAFGQAGPFGTYETFPDTSKLFMTLLMWVGRIEIIPVLVMLRLSFWRRP
ncbi:MULTISPECIES: TrkH family potassium uptake protein [Salinibaculum]|uniref:TrkH family potassium uptake protein n=1 Tax=Salinibaculum TaxID=2732368 RepID=UPI0030CD32E0